MVVIMQIVANQFSVVILSFAPKITGNHRIICFDRFNAGRCFLLAFMVLRLVCRIKSIRVFFVGLNFGVTELVSDS